MNLYGLVEAPATLANRSLNVQRCNKAELHVQRAPSETVSAKKQTRLPILLALLRTALFELL